MKKIYVCSPVRGDQSNLRVIEENLARAVMYSQYVYKHGHLPICPQIYLENATGLNEAKDPRCREQVLKLGVEMLVMCDGLWVFGRRFGEESEGMKRELEVARNKGIQVRYREEFLPKL